MRNIIMARVHFHINLSWKRHGKTCLLQVVWELPGNIPQAATGVWLACCMPGGPVPRPQRQVQALSSLEELTSDLSGAGFGPYWVIASW